MSNSIPQDPKDPRKPLEISPSASDDFEAGKKFFGRIFTSETSYSR